MATISVEEGYSPSTSTSIYPKTASDGYLFTTGVLQVPTKYSFKSPSRLLSPPSLPSITRMLKPSRQVQVRGYVLRLMPIPVGESLPTTESISIYPKSASDDVTSTFSESVSVTVS